MDKGVHFRVVDISQNAEVVSKQLNQHADEGFMITLYCGDKLVMVPVPPMATGLPEGTFVVPGAEGSA